MNINQYLKRKSIHTQFHLIETLLITDKRIIGPIFLLVVLYDILIVVGYSMPNLYIEIDR